MLILHACTSVKLQIIYMCMHIMSDLEIGELVAMGLHEDEAIE